MTRAEGVSTAHPWNETAWLRGVQPGGHWGPKLEMFSLASHAGFPNSYVAVGITVEEIVLCFSFLVWEQRIGVG